MILVTGGAGFIGAHTVRALVERGESCVIAQRRASGWPADLDGRVAVERVDIGDLEALRAIGTRHRITGIVHLAGSIPPWPSGGEQPIAEARKALDGLLNIVQVADEWGVKRLGIASTIGIYFGAELDGAVPEDLPLPMTIGHVIPGFKKIGELLGDHLATSAGIDIVHYRISAIWGPRGRNDPFFAAPALVNAAVNGTAPELSHMAQPPYAEDAIDLCYVKDCASAIAALQLADVLHHRVYNVASGRATSNAEVIAAIKRAIPDARVDLPHREPTPGFHLDTTRLRADTGFAPAYDVDRAVADYVEWLRAIAA
ncbi:MAG TPA: NAD(P)-dependent oxidoreductase [Stackebrandtia sp.]|jgi:UDP-glucose 4-epimerase|uniref:NAD-dependent epimerase/dehydratase family protein n=1 Tax=Stackebrandtia sp. TaxID=2023065 RepID=UPI002D464C02|nr:NAD(P)-dependent oxidoreductase [Stackebrandtia sp.]HZE38682.1 NAD(P)-dependent oxidoreductase [Stackebrandtia sp.]